MEVFRSFNSSHLEGRIARISGRLRERHPEIFRYCLKEWKAAFVVEKLKRAVVAFNA